MTKAKSRESLKQKEVRLLKMKEDLISFQNKVNDLEKEVNETFIQDLMSEFEKENLSRVDILNLFHEQFSLKEKATINNKNQENVERKETHENFI